MAELNTSTFADVFIIEFASESILDTTKAEAIGSELRQAVESTFVSKLLVNFHGVTLITSSIIGEFLKLKQKCTEENVQLKLCEMSNELTDLFKKIGLHKSFDIYPTSAKAMQAFMKAK